MKIPNILPTNNLSMCLVSEALKQRYSLTDIKLLSFGTGVNGLGDFLIRQKVGMEPVG
ncbi:MAG: hypothetical protein ACK5Z5_04100 [Neisseriaceae bacterium]